MSESIFSINKFIILLIFNLSFIKCPPRKYVKEMKVEEETLTIEKNDNVYRDFTAEWEEKMQDYDYEYIYNIPIKSRDQEIYFENVTTVPTTFKGAFFLSDETSNQIEFYIRDSDDKIIYEAKGHHNFFEFNITKSDRYSITFRNNIAKEEVIVTFIMNTGQNNMLVPKDLTNTEKKMDVLDALIRKFNVEFKFGRDVHAKRYKSN